MHKGFVDLQNNGWMGTDFGAPGLTVERVHEITRDLVARGTIAYLPTLVTTSEENYRASMQVIAQAMQDSTWGGHILGLHVEGPFISPEPGAVGAHPKQHVREPDIALFDRFQEWSGGNVKILTAAAGRPGCEELIRHVTAQGVVVSLGHQLATGEELARAVAAGATMGTHIGNGIPNTIHRHQNPLWWELACDKMYGCFITDGHHLPDELIKVALRAKGLERFVVTSDASPLAGMAPGKYELFEGLWVVIDDAGLIYSETSKSLAGSHSTMIECMNYMAALDLLDEAELWQVGLVNPLTALGLTEDDVAHLSGPDVVFKAGRFAVN